MRLHCFHFAIPLLASVLAVPAAAPPADTSIQRIDMVFTAMPGATDGWEKAKLLRHRADGSLQVLSEGFHSAADPEISFDGKRMLFAAKRSAGDRWQIYESNTDGSAARRMTEMDVDCRQPVYQSRFFTLDAPTPWDQVAFVAGGQLFTTPLEAAGGGQSAPQQITFLQGEASHPVVAPDGRVLFRFRAAAGGPARLFGVNLDGTDFALFHGEASADVWAAAVRNEEQLALLAEDRTERAQGAKLASVSLMRPRESFAWAHPAGLAEVHSIGAGPDGTLLAAAKMDGRFGIVRMEPGLKTFSVLRKDPGLNLVQPRWIAPRPLPDGRGSVVDSTVDWALLYCLNVSIGNKADGTPLKPGSVSRVRVLVAGGSGETTLGEGPVEADGSFHLRVPANQALRLELLSGEGQVLRRGAWIYARNKEARGCIGCHEDPELTPPNREPLAVRRPATDLTGRARQKGLHSSAGQGGDQ